MAGIDLSYCVVNTQQRELLSKALDAIAREQAALSITTEVLVLDNSSTDGSAGVARDHAAVDDLVVRRLVDLLRKGTSSIGFVTSPSCH